MSSRKDENRFTIRTHNKYPMLIDNLKILAKKNKTSVNKLILSVLDEYVAKEMINMNNLERLVKVDKIIDGKKFLLSLIVLDVFVIMNVILLAMQNLLTYFFGWIIFIYSAILIPLLVYRLILRQYVSKNFVNIIEKSNYILAKPEKIEPVNAVKEIITEKGIIYQLKKDKKEEVEIKYSEGLFCLQFESYIAILTNFPLKLISS